MIWTRAADHAANTGGVAMARQRKAAADFRRPAQRSALPAAALEFPCNCADSGCGRAELFLDAKPVEQRRQHAVQRQHARRLHVVSFQERQERLDYHLSQYAFPVIARMIEIVLDHLVFASFDPGIVDVSGEFAASEQQAKMTLIGAGVVLQPAGEQDFTANGKKLLS